MGWLYLFFIRLALGERWRKATACDKQLGAVMLFFIAAFFTIFALMEHSSHLLRLYENAGALVLWIVWMVLVPAGVFGCFVWIKYVPAKVTVALAILTWGVLLFLLFGLGYWDGGNRP